MDIAGLIHEWRIAKEFTLKNLAEATGLSISFLSDIERGRTDPSVKTLLKIAAAFDMKLDIRFVRDGEQVLPPGTVLYSQNALGDAARVLRTVANFLQMDEDGR